MGILLGAIADDFTGATDLANTLVKGGMRAIQLIGVPGEDMTLPETDALVIALKSRTIPPKDAVRQSLTALHWLEGRGTEQYYFKYCSTFDSTDEGNIGPVADALIEELGADFAIACPAFPAAGRTIYKGYLFVGDVLLSESGMRDHPLTPMRDSNLVAVLGRQTAGKVGLVAHEAVRAGAEAIRERFEALRSDGVRHAIVDILADEDLMALGEACSNHRIVTGGSGAALGLPENFRKAGRLGKATAAAVPQPRGRQAVLAGSCSAATLRQVAHASALWPTLKLDPLAMDAEGMTRAALEWSRQHTGGQPLLIYSTQTPEEVRKVQARHGRGQAGEMIETAMGGIARGLVDKGVRELIVAGGETSGAVVGALGVRALEIGPEIDPGVPWTTALGEVPLALALKSGNFGGDDFFSKAFGMLK